MKQVEKRKFLRFCDTQLPRVCRLSFAENVMLNSFAGRVFYISFVFSNARRVLSQCITRVRLLCEVHNFFEKFITAMIIAHLIMLLYFLKKLTL